MKPIFRTLIGQRIKNKLIEHALKNDYRGTYKDLLISIDNCESVVKICHEAIADVIQAEVEVLAQRDLKEESGNVPLFIAGLLHAQDLILKDSSLIGNIDIE